MKTGFQLLKTRLINKPCEDLDALEQKYDIKLPPLYRLYYQTFEPKLITPNRGVIYYPDGNVGFEYFNESIENTIKIFKAEPTNYKGCMLPVITSGMHTGGICVCISGENHDKIYIDNEMFDDQFELIADNIFEFVKGLMEVPADKEATDFYLKNNY